MFFYIVLAPVLLAMLCMIIRLHATNKYDSVLFPMCDLRRDVMALLRERGQHLSAEEYRSAREVVAILNIAIHHYHRHKLRMFNLRDFMRLMEAYTVSASKLSDVQESSDPEIERFRQRLAECIVLGFIRLTPFIKSEILIRFAVWMLGTIAHFGLKQSRRFVEALRDAVDVTNEQVRIHNLQPALASRWL